MVTGVFSDENLHRDSMFRKAGRKNEWTITIKAPPQNGKVSAEKNRRQKGFVPLQGMRF
ncbi:hypothetical protein [Treponema socranskii]|uniref:hypothetical protein n=1 Tax=Treponema socranskii TaxID=53419 RepID=UPI003D6E167D